MERRPQESESMDTAQSREENHPEHENSNNSNSSQSLKDDNKKKPKEWNQSDFKKKNREGLEEAKRKSREEQRRMREERAARRQQSDSDSDTDYLVGKLAEIAVSTKDPDIIEGTGLIYDERMLQHKNLWDPNFPERPERASDSFRRCYELGLVERCVRLEAQVGTEDMILLQHSQELIDKLKSTTGMNVDKLKEMSMGYHSIYLNNSTFECSLLSLGSVMELMEQILKKKIRNGLAIVRPPGHHAMYNEFCGFCFFNNVAVAAKHALDNLGLKKILIVDWDVHHGQATQRMFYNDPRVLYFSIHRYEYGNYWPHLRESDYDFIGEDAGKGFNINVPLNKIGMTNSDYMAIFHQILMPVAYEFCPDLVLVSAGFDCAVGCPEYDPDLVLVSAGFDSAIGDFKGEMSVTPAMFAHMTHMLKPLAQGRLCVCLEGGYCIQSLAESVALTLRCLLGDPCPPIPALEEPSDSVTASILNVIKMIRPFWKCLQYQESENSPCPFDEVNTMPPREGVKFNKDDDPFENFEIEYTYPDNVERDYRKENKFGPIIDKLIAETSLAVPQHRTCIGYDEGMRAHVASNTFYHPEDPDRISRIYDQHVKWGLDKRCQRLEVRLATEAELQLIHSEAHVEQMKTIEDKNPLQLRQMQQTFNSVYMCSASYMCARMSCGFVLEAVDSVLKGEVRSGVAIVRPPGHHAECTKAMGFCFFNNVAVAAKYAQNKYGVKRVMIVDWDVHHGNGTQHQFYEDDSVLFISLHRYDNGFFYPSSKDGDYCNVGSGPGTGYNVNIAWNDGPMGDPEYIAAFQQIVMPIAYEFNPELVLVSAGFDAAMGDPLGSYLITPLGYGHMTHMLTSLANGKVVLMLEGGYHLVAISNSMATCTSILLGDACPHLPYAPPKDSAVKCIKQVLDTHKEYWKCLKFRVNIQSSKPTTEEEGNEAKDEENAEKNTDLVTNVDELADQLMNVSVQNTKPSETSETSQVASAGYPLATDASTITLTSKDNIQDKNQEESKPGQVQTIKVKMSGVDGAKGAEASVPEVKGAEGGLELPQASSVSATEILREMEAQGHSQLFAVQPLTWCPHLETVQEVPRAGIDTSQPCEDCGDLSENWTCLICYRIFCSRFVNEHMLMHGVMERHLMCLSFSDLSVWCYGCDNYIDNQILFPAKNEAHRRKFGSSLPQQSN